jgi:hypothetical protein
VAVIKVRVSEETLAELQMVAAVEGKSVDEMAEAALRMGLEERIWQDLLSYGRDVVVRLGA